MRKSPLCHMQQPRPRSDCASAQSEQGFLCSSACPTVTMSAAVAQMDARPTVNSEVAGSTPARSATFFREDLNMKYFL